LIQSANSFVNTEIGTSPNLQLQKILYLAQMIYMGHTAGGRLADGSFEAWDYGPVEPSVYRKVRMFGSDPISNVFFGARVFSKDDERRRILGAWPRTYCVGVQVN
jgi:uncharacterized phage-associated protein